MEKLDFRIERTYLFLHRAFVELLNEKRFEDITVNEMCDRAMIRRATFYRHFADKYEYFAFFVNELVREFQSQFPEPNYADDFRGYSRHMTTTFIQFLNQNRKMIDHLMTSHMFPVLLDSLFDTVTKTLIPILRNMEQTRSLTEQQMESLAAFYAGGLLSMLRICWKQGGKINEADFLATIDKMLIYKDDVGS